MLFELDTDLGQAQGFPCCICKHRNLKDYECGDCALYQFVYKPEELHDAINQMMREKSEEEKAYQQSIGASA